MMWKLLLVSLAAARALPSSLSSADSLEPTRRALDELEEDVQFRPVPNGGHAACASAFSRT